MITITIAVALLLAMATPETSLLTPLAEYNQGRRWVKRYNFKEAIRVAGAGMARYCPGQPVSCAYFRLLRAEADTFRGEPRDALKLLDPLPRELAGTPFEARRLYLRAYATFHAFGPAKAEPLLLPAEKLARQVAPDLDDELQLLRAVMLIRSGHHDQAREIILSVRDRARRRKDAFVEGNALGNLAFTALWDDRITDALALLEQARRAFQNVGVVPTKITLNTAYCLQQLGDYDAAIERMREAMAGFEQQGAVRDQVVSMTNIGVIEYYRGNYPVAEDIFQKALAIARRAQLFSEHQILLSELAALSVSMGAYDNAERFAQEAMTRMRASNDSRGQLIASLNIGRVKDARGQDAEAETIYRNIVANAGTNKALLWDAQAHLASLYARKGRDADAEREYRNALATGDTAREDVPEELRLSFQDLVNGFYHDYIAFLADHKRPNDALRVAEHARARTLEEGLGFASPALQADDPRAVARQFGGTILSYWLAPNRSYLWVITGKVLRMEILPPAGTIERLVGDYGKDLLGMDEALRSTSGASLYRMLVAPAGVDRDARVAIIPDGPLNALNFETLIAGDHYWIEDVTITTSSSVALLSVRRNTGSGHSLLLVNGVPPRDSGFPALPNAEMEAKRVAEQFPQRVVLQGKNATPSAYKKEPQSFDFVHFVAHGVAVRTTPLESSIVLARDASGGYQLFARDIIHQRLRARLVTISSCHGAGVRAYTGEGLVGLAWAFLRAGAHQVVAALWEVNDSATPDLMGNMYAGIRAGRDPATALRDAKIKLLESNSVYRKPRYWAPFVLYSGAR